MGLKISFQSGFLIKKQTTSKAVFLSKRKINPKVYALVSIFSLIHKAVRVTYS